MFRLIAILITTFLMVACADNPLGLAGGMWVRNKLDGQKYYITRLDVQNNAEHGGIVRVKNELGAEVDKDFAIYDFELWIERKEVPDGASNSLMSRVEALSERVRVLEEKLDVKPTGERHWNPETQKYE